MFFNRKYNFIFIIVIILFSCEKESQTSSNNQDNQYNFTEETILLDANGEVIETTISIDHFSPSQECQTCHQQHFEEWSSSMHAHSFHDPIFFNLWVHEQENRPSTGENYCIQCHAPSAFVSDYNLSQVSSINDISLLTEPVKDGISCQFCHNMINTSTDVYTQDNVAAVADYYLSVDKEVMFGPIQNPEENDYHESYYSDIYDNSGICLPCHSQFIRDMSIETTFQEWNDFPAFSMSDGNNCQSCHMQIQSDGHHNHSFPGVDFHDLTSPIDLSSQEYIKIMELMNSSAELDFIGLLDTIVEDIQINSILSIPIKVKSFTGHKFPSGTTFSREAWLELKVIDQNQNLIYSSGVINDNSENLNYNDQNLLVFTSWLLNENGDTIREASNAYNYIDKTLNTMGVRFHNYEILIDESMNGPLSISARLRFRALKPFILAEFNPELLSNIPIYEIDSISTQINILGQ